MPEINLWAFHQPFAQAFPELEDAVVEWEVWGRDLIGEVAPKGRSTMSVRAGYFQGLIPCSDPACQGGGYEIERTVDDMVQKGEEAREGFIICPGWTADVDRIPCVNSITFKISLKYKARKPPEKSSG
ncbi:MAG: hypothetical protein ACE5I9_13345 [Candidatus Methylomirabilales bacterium]